MCFLEYNKDEITSQLKNYDKTTNNGENKISGIQKTSRKGNGKNESVRQGTSGSNDQIPKGNGADKGVNKGDLVILLP